MSIFPLQGATSLIASGAPLKAAASVVSNTGSAFAGMLKRAVSNAPKEPAANDKSAAETPQETVNGIDVAKLRAGNAVQIDGFAKQFHALLKEAGIDPGEDLELQLDASGRVRVVGSPFDKDKIESLLASHPDLSRQFREIAANSGLLQAIDEAVRCQQTAETSDPRSLVTDSPHLFARGDATKFTLRLLQDHAEASFSAPSVQ